MSLEGPYRVHIAPQGYEDERIYNPAIKKDADSVLLLVHEEEDEQAEECFNEVVSKLDEHNIDWNPVECNIFDMEDSLRKITEVVQGNSANQYFVNISTGSKITAIAGMIACMVTGATPYYVKAEDYGGATVSRGVKDVVGLPAYPIELPNEEQIRILSFIKEREDAGKEVAIKDLIALINDEQMSFIENVDREDEENIYDIIQEYVIPPLRNRHYIRAQKFGNQVLISLTKEGKSTLSVSQYLLEGPK